jgi:hypothetical protein
VRLDPLVYPFKYRPFASGELRHPETSRTRVGVEPPSALESMHGVGRVARGRIDAGICSWLISDQQVQVQPTLARGSEQMPHNGKCDPDGQGAQVNYDVGQVIQWKCVDQADGRAPPDHRVVRSEDIHVHDRTTGQKRPKLLLMGIGSGNQSRGRPGSFLPEKKPSCPRTGVLSYEFCHVR